MSFGRPGSFSDFTKTPPDRGSFPLDHYGECKDQMMGYLKCLRSNGQNSTPCRLLGKSYLECRMTNGLMGRDDWHNLGMSGLENPPDLVSAKQGESTDSKNTTPSSDTPQLKPKS